MSRDLADDDAELVRREHIGHEMNIKSLGHLNYLLACFWSFFVVFAILMATGVIPLPPNQRGGADQDMQKIIMGAGAVFYLVLATINGSLGFGLTHLHVWARWAAIVFIVLAILWVGLLATFAFMAFNPAVGLGILIVGEGILGLALSLLVVPKSGVVFSADYREIRRKTPHIKYRTSLIVKVLLVMILAAGVIIAAGLFSGGGR